MDKLVCRFEKSESGYDILIEQGLFEHAPELIKSVVKGRKAAVITDSNVLPLYAGRLKKQLEAAGFEAHVYSFPAGETSKNIITVSEIYSFFCDCGITRSDFAVALGGGVAGDMCGFAAATYLRGIDFIQIPTTLLADVDSSVGGKTGYDLPQGKNLVGAFYQPSLVLIDPLLLNTLPKDVYADGMAEVIKSAAIRDRRLFEDIEAGSYNDEKLISGALLVKRDIVLKDERDHGLRALLNFGHTFGHAAEKLGGYRKLSHGSAVAAGMVAAARVGEKLGLTPKKTAERLASLLKKYNLPVSFSFAAEDLFEAMKNDKKNLSGKMGLVLLEDIGAGFVHEMSLDELKAAVIAAL